MFTDDGRRPRIPFWRKLTQGIVVVALLAAASCTGGPPSEGFKILSGELFTRVPVEAGDAVHVVATGKISFGGEVFRLFSWRIGAPELDADGDDWATPAGYPAPGKRKNSLICWVHSVAYQCGKDRQFSPPDAGEIKLEVNDAAGHDNEGGWFVTIVVTTPTGVTTTYTKPPQVTPGKPSIGIGPLDVRGAPVRFHRDVQAGSVVETVVDPDRKLDLGQGILLNADGDSWLTPDGYPVRALKKNSLICRVGSLWYQCGTKSRFVPITSGPLDLAVNDQSYEDNGRDSNHASWPATVYVYPPGTPGSAETPWGPITVATSEVATGIKVASGTTVQIAAEGHILFNILAIRDADGDPGFAPLVYPAPSLRPNSLIWRVGERGRWRQGAKGITERVGEAGEIFLRANDSVLVDNGGSWQVRIAMIVASPDASTGPQTWPAIPVSNAPVHSGIQLKSGSTLEMSVDPSELLDLGGFLIGVKLNADGDNFSAPDGYPDKSLRKNSLIWKVGESGQWHQGGVSVKQVVTEDGELILQPNDQPMHDNSRAWHVTITVTPPSTASGN
jgi:hypothetical protein